MKGLDLPSLCVSFQLLDDVEARTHRQVCNQFPVDLVAVLWRAFLGGVNDGKDQLAIILLFAYRWTNQHATKTYLENRGRQPPRLLRTWSECSPRSSRPFIPAPTVVGPFSGQTDYAGANHACPVASPSRTTHRCRLDDPRYEYSGSDHRAARWTSAGSPTNECSFNWHEGVINPALQSVRP